MPQLAERRRLLDLLRVRGLGADQGAAAEVALAALWPNIFFALPRPDRGSGLEALYAGLYAGDAPGRLLGATAAEEDGAVSVGCRFEPTADADLDAWAGWFTTKVAAWAHDQAGRRPPLREYEVEAVERTGTNELRTTVRFRPRFPGG